VLQALAFRQLVTGALYGILDRGIDLVLYCAVFGESASHHLFPGLLCQPRL
jgi:hypothetical protein